MRNDDRILAYKWLYETLRRHPRGLTQEEINELWVENEDLSGGEYLTRNTFKNYRSSCEKLYHVAIECDNKHGYRYYIYNNSSHIDDVRDYMMQSIAIGKVLKDSENVHDRILVEPMPSSDYVEDIIKAMNLNRKISFLFQDYGENKATSVVLEPYALKTYHHRWYLLGKKVDGEMIIYNLDRVKDVARMKEHFEMDELFSAADFFADFFAVRVEPSKPMEHIVLRAYKKQQYKIINQPLHHSQKVVGQGDGWTDFSFDMRPTYDFVSYLESLGKYIRVIEPLSLREELLRVHKDAIEMNKSNK